MLPKNILMVVHSYYLDDTRVRREAESLIEAGMKVDVICLNKGNEPTNEEFKGVKIFRCNIGRSSKRTKLSYITEYLSFFLKSFYRASKLSLNTRYDVFFAHNMPNFLVFSGLIAKIKGAKLILDMHDSMPELYTNIFGLKEGVLLNLLRFEERISVTFVNYCMTANEPIAEILRKRNKTGFEVVHNTPDLSVLFVDERKNVNNKRFKLFHHGNIHQRYGLDRVLPHLTELNKDNWQYELEVHGRGPWYDSVKSKAKELGVTHYCKFNGGFKPQDIGESLATADLGLVLNHKNPLTDLLLPVKMLEYISCKIPVISPRTAAVEHYFDDSSVYFFDSDDELAELIQHIKLNPKEAQDKAIAAYSVYSSMDWQQEKQNFVEFVQKI